MAKKPFGYFIGRTDLTPNPEFVRDAKVEKEVASRPYFIKEAADRGMTAEEYIESRGGINDANVYGDSFAVYGASEYLTKAEEDAVLVHLLLIILVHLLLIILLVKLLLLAQQECFLKMAAFIQEFT